MRPQRVLAPDRVGQRVRRAEPAVSITQEQLGRIAVIAAVSIHSDAVIEDREIGSPVAVEVVRDDDRGAHVDRPFDQLRRVSEPAIPYAGEHAQRGLRESVFGRRAVVVLGAPSRENIVAAIAVEICDGMHESKRAEVRLGDHARKGDPRERLTFGCGTAEQRYAEGCHEGLRQHRYYPCVPVRPRPPVVAPHAPATQTCTRCSDPVRRSPSSPPPTPLSVSSRSRSSFTFPKLPPLTIRLAAIRCIDRVSGLFRHASRFTSRNDAPVVVIHDSRPPASNAAHRLYRSFGADRVEVILVEAVTAFRVVSVMATRAA